MEAYIKFLKEQIKDLEQSREFWRDLAFKLLEANKKLGDKLNEV